MALSLVVLALSWLPLPVADWGLTSAGGCTPRLAYLWLHATPLHAVVNVWCLLSIVFTYRLHLSSLLWALLSAMLLPACCLAPEPTVGLSGAIYFLFGRVTWMTSRRLYFTSWILAYLALSWLLPGTNGWAHAWGYACGLVYGLLNTPLVWIKKSNKS